MPADPVREETGGGPKIDNGIPRDFWREVPCGHPSEPVAMWTNDGDATCHCGSMLDPNTTLSIDAPEAPGPIVYCQKCGCHVAVPPQPEPTPSVSQQDPDLEQLARELGFPDARTAIEARRTCPDVSQHGTGERERHEESMAREARGAQGAIVAGAKRHVENRGHEVELERTQSRWTLPAPAPSEEER